MKVRSVLESANPAWTWSVHLDAPGQRHRQQPVSGTADPRVVNQDKSSRGSVDTTKTRSDPQRVRMSSGKRPIGAAKGKQPNTGALCQTPPTPPPHPVGKQMTIHNQQSGTAPTPKEFLHGGGFPTGTFPSVPLLALPLLKYTAKQRGNPRKEQHKNIDVIYAHRGGLVMGSSAK